VFTSPSLTRGSKNNWNKKRALHFCIVIRNS
jgi:hypothetical protein